MFTRFTHPFQTDQKIKNLSADEAVKLAAVDPDYSVRGLYDAIHRGEYPSWSFYIQVMTLKQAKTFRWNPFDVTKVLIHALNMIVILLVSPKH